MTRRASARFRSPAGGRLARLGLFNFRFARDTGVGYIVAAKPPLVLLLLGKLLKPFLGELVTKRGSLLIPLPRLLEVLRTVQAPLVKRP